MTVFEHYQRISLYARDVYDALDAGDKARLKRCGSADEVRSRGAAGTFWQIANEVDLHHEPDVQRLAEVVACFPMAPARRQGDRQHFDLGRHLQSRIWSALTKSDDRITGALAFRRLLAARDREDLVHQLRRLLHRAAQPNDAGAGVDWGVVGAQLWLWNDTMGLRWASGFYAEPMSDTLEREFEGDAA